MIREVVIDANVLVQAPLRDTLLRLAEGPALFKPIWTADIMDEVRRTLTFRFGIASERVERLESKLREHFGEAWVDGYQPLVELMSNDTKDRHVLAAAVKAKAEWLVSYNLKHFPAEATEPWKIRAIGPSAFLKMLYAADSSAVVRVLREQAADIERSFEEQLRVLSKAVPAFVEVVCVDTDTKL